MRPSGRTGRRAGALIRQFVIAALAVAAPPLCLAQTVGADTMGLEQGLPNVSGSPGAALPGATLPGETPMEVGPEPAELIRYGIAAGIGESDNINLSQTNPKSQTLAATDLDFDLKRTGSRLDASALGNFTDIDYLEGAYSNQVLGRFDGLADVKLWSDRLKWIVADHYGEEQTDPFQAVTPLNLQRVNVFSTGPDLTLRPSYSTFVNLDARYTQNSYQSSPFDGHNLMGSAALGEQLSPLSSLSLVVQAEELRFDNTLVNTNFDRREAYARYLVKGARTSIDAQLGVTQANDVASSWKTSPLVRLLLTRQVSPFSMVSLAGGREFTDAAGSFASLTSGAGGGIAVAPVTQTTGNYQRTYGSAGWEFTRLRTSFGFTGSWERDEYDTQTVFDTTREELGFNLGRAITTQLALSLTGSVERYSYLHQGFTDKFGTVGGGVTYRPGRWFIVYARYDHAFRRGSGIPSQLLGTSEYDENRVFIMVGYRPHSAEMEQEGGAPGYGSAPAP